MKKVLLLMSIIIASLLAQSCICCDHGFRGPGYSYGYYYDDAPHHGGHHYGRPHPGRW